MTEVFAVALNDTVIGGIQAEGERSEFFFIEQYLATPRRPVLGLHFEDNIFARRVNSVRLHPWFSNLLPEGTLRAWIAADRGVSSRREMKLLEHVGHDLPGAVRVIPSNVTELRRVEYRSELEYEERSPEEVADPWRFSLAGVALKMSMLHSFERLTIPSRGATGDTLVKFPDSNFGNVPLNEWAMMRFAGRVGISVPKVMRVHREDIEAPDSVWRNGESWAYAVSRFDRGESGQRIHIEDLAQVRGKYPEDKYHSSFETLAALIYRHHDEESLKELVRRQIFNIMIGNGDAHLKNWSLIYKDPSNPTLAPAYDLVSTAPYRPAGQIENLALRMGGSKKFERVRIRDLKKLSELLGGPEGLEDVGYAVVDDMLETFDAVAVDLKEAPELVKSIQLGMTARARTLRL